MDTMTTRNRQSAHATCGHENTKAARAKCRATERKVREGSSLTIKKAADKPAVRGKPKASSARRVDKPVNTSLPHAFEEDMERPGRCWVCKLTRTARVHSEGPSDLSAKFF